MTRTRGRAVAVLAVVTIMAGVVAVTSAATANAAARSGRSENTTTQSRVGAVWQPAENTDWMWELSQPLKLTNPKLMGTGVKAYNGDTPPTDNPRLYDIDAIENPASTVAALHRRGDHAICYIEVGTAGNYYTAGQEGIPVTYYKELKNAGRST
jgi:hypothetical protein